MKKLPIGISTFSQIIKEDYLYIDKTEETYELITNYKYSFLSRPRRFGKSLLVSTIEEIFEGNKRLFKGLYIYDKWDWEDKYPVIKISFSGDLRTPNKLKNRINDILIQNQERLEIECKKIEKYDSCFEELIKNSYYKYNKKVVILIDEYDKAILDNLDQMKIAHENREILKSLYGIIKENDRYIKFAFLTGVSKFSKASIFSGLNNLRDISLLPKFGEICGYTQKNIENEFLPYLKGVDLEELKKWYNGYNFLKNRVYNPFDILLFIDSGYMFKNYWFETGTPTFLVKLFKQERYNLAKFENLEVNEDLINSFDIDNISLETVMFQSGYLTIGKVTNKRRRFIYQLQYPNFETKMSFNDYILGYLVNNKIQKFEIQNILIDILEISDLEKLETTLKSLFASIAYNNFTNNHIQNYEGFYASVIYAYFAGAGFDEIIAEDVTNSGRVDLSVFIDDKVYIFEFKVNSSGALAQIKARGYHQKYTNRYNDIYLVGVEFDSEKRNLVKCEWEKLK